MSKVPLVYTSFEGGLGTDLKTGLKNAFAGTAGSGSLGTYGVDYRKNPSQFSVLPGTAREDKGVVNDLIQNEVMVSDGTIYAIGSKGLFYRRTTAGSWSVEAGINIGTFGIDYRKDTDNIYIPTMKSVSLYSGVSTTTPAMYMNFYGPSYSQYNNTNTNGGLNFSSFQTGGAVTYQPPTTITENSVNLRYFQSDIEPLVKISVFIVNKGTGDWTLTLHDGTNKVLGSATVTNANLANNSFNDFTFTSATNGQVRIYIAPNARTYHFHVTSTVADGTLSTSSANDLSNCDLKVWADRLVQTNNGMHPMTRFLQYEIIGNGNYVSVWEPLNSTDTTTMTSPETSAEWVQHKLVFPMEYEVNAVDKTNEFLVISLGQSTSNTNSEPQSGLLAFWDGLSPTYNYFVPIPEGSPQGMHTYKNVVYYYAGGALYGITSPTTQPVKLRSMPGTDTEFSGAPAPIIVYPYSMAVRRGIHLFGFPAMTTNTTVNYGVYSWGAVDKNYPDSLGYSYLISTGSTNYSASNNLTIGMVKNFGDTLHISWRDTLNGGYGIDVINNSSAPAVNSSWESLIFDNGFPAKRKKAIRIYANFFALPSDTSFVLKYKIDRTSSWTYSPIFNTASIASATDGGDSVHFDISPATYFHEFQFGIDITSGTTPPAFTSMTLIFDDTSDEQVGGGGQ